MRPYAGDHFYTSGDGDGGTTTDTDGETDWEISEEEFEQYAVPKEAVIVFLDVDSFEVQVRGRNAGIHSETLKREPYVVVNDHKVITAVNYPAKTFGIRRSKECTLRNARDLCPNLNVLEIPQHYGKPDALGLRKASDKIYASLERSLQNWCGERPLPKIEKASKDEFFIDVTDEVYHRVHRMRMAVPNYTEVNVLKERRCFLEAPSYSAKGDKLSYRTLQVLTNKSIIEERHVTEALLMHGAVIAHWILRDIQQETGFTVSAGISSNKLLSKLGCGHNKPDAITVLPHSSLGRVAKKIQVTDIPGLGGKMGKLLHDKLKIDTMSRLSHMDRVSLMKAMGTEQALKFHQLAVGHDPTKVVAKKFCNSLACGITFNYRTRRMHKPEDFLDHLENRFYEMRDHLIYECSHNGLFRVPKALRLEVRTRKRNLKVAFGKTLELNTKLRNCIASEAASFSKGTESFWGAKLSNPWVNLYETFVEHVKEESKINVLDENNFKAACAAIRKVSEINLIANFSPMPGDED